MRKLALGLVVSLWFGLSCFSFGVTKEVVQVFFAYSFHDTDSAMASVDGSGQFLQAEVCSCPIVLSGAFPEDLIAIVAQPRTLASNSSAYNVSDANLLSLCKIGLSAIVAGESIEVFIDCEKYQKPEFLELTDEQVLRFAVRAVGETLKSYYKESGEEGVSVELKLVNTKGELEKWSEALDQVFEVGGGS